jgi:hypothetical protein
MGRAYRVIKRTTHLTVRVAESEDRRPAAKAEPARKTGARRARKSEESK